MYKYNGFIVHQCVDEQGLIEVIDDGNVRALHFGSDSRQSSMLLEQPNHLLSLYARAMMSLLLFNSQPKNILMMGLGGGSIPKYLLDQFAECKIKVIEYRNSVLKVARSHFQLPRNPRLEVKIGCGAEFISKQNKISEASYDLIIIDAFDYKGMSTEIGCENFFDGCRTLLNEQGLLAINLWGSENEFFQQIKFNMERVFEEKVLLLPVRRRGNIIAFCFKNISTKYSIKQLREQAKQLESLYQFDFPSYLKDIQRNNTATLTKIFIK